MKQQPRWITPSGRLGAPPKNEASKKIKWKVESSYPTNVGQRFCPWAKQSGNKDIIITNVITKTRLMHFNRKLNKILKRKDRVKVPLSIKCCKRVLNLGLLI